MTMTKIKLKIKKQLIQDFGMNQKCMINGRMVELYITMKKNHSSLMLIMSIILK
jgi:hypothetical protein